MRPSFLALREPHLSAIIIETTPEQTINSILTCEHDGAESFVLDVTGWDRDKLCRTELARVFHCTGRPMMPLFYRSRNLTADKVSDDERAELMLLAVDAGAAACDIMGDMYDPSPRERTRDQTAIEKQRNLINRIHALGAEVLMSSHAQSEALSAEEVLEHLSDFTARGVDIPKIVLRADTKAELLEAFRTTVLLKEKLNAPFVHLCSGAYGRLQRYVAPSLGACLTFGVRNPGQGPQPFVSAARDVLDELNWHLPYPEDD
jgi:3-dehydroquinate dehydratase